MRTNKRSILPLLIGPALLLAGEAHATLDSISLGASVTAPMGDAYLTYGKSTSFHGQVHYRIPEFSQYFSVGGTFEYIPLRLQNNPGVETKINIWGATVGLEYQTPSEGAALLPFFGLHGGIVYDVLSVADTTSSVQNQAISLAARLSPGVEIPIMSGVSALMSTPVNVIFVRNPIALWSGSFGLKVKL